MNNNLVIGITGPMGSGKSFMSCVLERYGYIHFDVDKIAKNLINRNSECKNELRDVFGKDILDNNLNLNRNILGLRAFSSTENLLKLGYVVNPYIKGEMQRLISKTNGKIVIDAVTLFNAGLDEFCKCKIYVATSLDIRYKRIVERDKISKEMAIQRIKSQKKELFFYRKCDFIFDGNLTENKIIEKISEMIIKIENM